ncbi:MAG: M36 family metallopeptidase [Woeseia sp.]|nr:M36 family metallopeptidase [Woeseia sp.]
MRTPENNWRSSIRSKWTSAVVATTAMIFMPLANASMFGDFDARQGSVEPNATQLGMVSAMGANARWTQFGTPSSLINYGDYLATGLSGPDATTVARNWVDANKALFRLSSVDGLKVMSDEAFPHSQVYAVSFQQEIDGMRAVEGGSLTIGIVGNAADGWNIGYASASTTGDASVSGSIALTAAEALVKATENIGAAIQISDIVTTKIDGEWTTFNVSGFGEPQRARLRAMPTPNNGVRPVYETVYLKDVNTMPQAYVHYVDAQDGTVWMRKDIVEEAHPGPANVFTGSFADNVDGACALSPEYEVTAPGVGTVAYSGSAVLFADDATIGLYRDGALVSSQDTGFSPEANAYTPGDDGVGTYQVEVCDYVDGVAWINNEHFGEISFFDVGSGDAPVSAYPPKWNVFPANPEYASFAEGGTDNRKLWCWESVAGCDAEVGNIFARVPWDYDAKTNTPTFTTRGNNAFASLSASPLTPSVPYQPTATDRDYSFEFNDAWAVAVCDQTSFAADAANGGVGGPDADEAVTNLFAMHNRMHDWSYGLGFTERRWNAQSSNFGNNSAGTLENDPVFGNAQAGGFGGGFPSYLGRDNANMITLQDGISPITNMYLWQPLAGAFYAPCKDGDYDMAIIGHEYGHMIENRMIGHGDGRSGHHAGAMGESFGDFVGMEVLNEYDYVPVGGENKFSVGGYATGNGERAIRNYNMSYPRTGAFPEPGTSTTGSGPWMGTPVNPLNFSNMGYDLTGPQVHADGEIYSATNFSVRAELVSKYAPDYPPEGSQDWIDLQKACADGVINPANCPGNRRWIQIVFDAMLLMVSPAPTMLDARDAYLAADLMRFGPVGNFGVDESNQVELWKAFAQRGMGDLADAKGNGTADPVPDFSSRVSDNAEITFAVVDENGTPIGADIYVGHFEADVSPVADTHPGAALEINRDENASFAPGEYEFLVRADGFGHFRFRQTFAATDDKTLTITMPTNYASEAMGGLASGAGSDFIALIDDTEATAWDKAPDNVAINVGQPTVVVDLAGGAHTINRVQVSALVRGHNRFVALREFRVETSTNGVLFQPWITSGPDAFPGHNPRPVSPEMIIRSFEGEPRLASHVRIVAMNNQCTGNPAFHDDGNPNTADHDNDLANVTDCRDTRVFSDVPIPLLGADEVLAPRHDEVHIAELQVFAADGTVECTSGCEVNAAPVANDDPGMSPAIAVNASGSVNYDVRLNDTDDSDLSGDLTVTIVSNGMSGSAVVQMDGTVTYTHGGDMATSDTFTYYVTDSEGATSNTATVTITINQDTGGGNEAPVANDDPGMAPAIEVNASGSVNYDVRLNDTDDSDLSGDLTVTIVSNGMSGSAVVQMDGTVTYTHGGDMATSDTFTYYVTDSEGATSNTATVTITINQDNGGENECSNDTDSDYHDCRVKGSGKLNDGNDPNDDSDSDKFTIETKQKGANPDGSPHVDGKLYFDTDGPTRKVRGTPNAQSINGGDATVTGICEYEFEDDDKIACTFEVDVTETDQFGIKIYDMSGALLYEYSKQTITYGEIDVRSDEEYQ